MLFLKKFCAIGFFLLILTSDQALAASQATDYGLKAAADEAHIQSNYSKDALPGLAGTVIGSLLSVMGVIFFILMTYGGFLWMTARGNEDQITRGRETIIAAVIGILIVVGSYGLTRFVLKSVEPTPRPAQSSLPQAPAPTPQSNCNHDSDCPSDPPGLSCLQHRCI